VKFLCVPCDRPMKIDRTRSDRGAIAVTYGCPDCGYEFAMLTNPMETQVVSSLGIKIGADGSAEGSKCPFTGIVQGIGEPDSRDSFPWTPEAEARLAGARPVNPEAYEAYLKGMFHRDKLSSADLETALQYFELALEKDPNYALAYVGIARVWGSRQQMGFVLPHEAGPRAKTAAQKAIELDSTLAEAHHTLASIKAWSDWDWEGGETAFRRAIQLKPNYPAARAIYSHLLMILGRPDEAMAQIERALELDPLNGLFQGFYGMDLLMARRYDEALAQFQNTLKTAPNNPMLRTGLRDALYALGRYDEALTEVKTRFAAAGERELAEALERGYAEGGYREAMRRAAETRAARSDTTFVPPLGLASLFAHAGETERVLEWLEKAYQERDPNLPYIGVIPLFDIVRDDPRFQDLLLRMNLPGRVDG